MSLTRRQGYTACEEIVRNSSREAGECLVPQGGTAMCSASQVCLSVLRSRTSPVSTNKPACCSQAVEVPPSRCSYSYHCWFAAQPARRRSEPGLQPSLLNQGQCRRGETPFKMFLCVAVCWKDPSSLEMRDFNPGDVAFNRCTWWPTSSHGCWGAVRAMFCQGLQT